MILLILMLVILAVLLIGASLLSAWSILHPPRMTDAKALVVLKRLSPADLGMHFESLGFSVRDQQTGRMLRLAGWWIPHSSPSRKTVVFIHGYADAKVGSIAWAPVWRELGFHILAVDLRAHGESEGSCTTAGVFERHDLDQVINQLRAARPQQAERLVLFGVSLGAAVALGTAELRDDLAGLVLECPFASFRRAVEAHVRLLQLPLPTMLPMTFWCARQLAGAEFDQIRPLEALARLKCPVMVIHAEDDALIPRTDMEQIRHVVMQKGDGSEYWQVPGAAHLRAMQLDSDAYRGRLEAFLNKL